MAPGRPRIHEDERARKRAYYQRNKEKLQRKARDSYHARRTQQQVRSGAAERSPKKKASKCANYQHVAVAKFYFVECVKKVLGPDMIIDSDCDWARLVRALKKDLGTWKGDFNDDATCFREYTKLAMKISRDGRPVSVLEEVMQYPFGVVKQIHALATTAAERCIEALEDDEQSATSELYGDFMRIAKDADLMECALREVMTLFNDSPDTLEDLYYSDELMWNFL